MKRDWDVIQKFYDDNHTWRDVIKYFKISNKTLMNAVNISLFKPRNKKDAIKLAHQKNPRILSEDTKNKISNGMKKFLMNHPDKVPYLLNHYSKGPSYPELYFDNIFKDNFKYDKYVQIGLYHIDFAIIDKKIAIEIDGEQHYLDKRIVISDKNKDNLLLENGWDLIRIRWSHYQQLDKIEKEKYVNNLSNYINGISENKPTINTK
jgi:very-short-patch-repair endonuclease